MTSSRRQPFCACADSVARWRLWFCRKGLFRLTTSGHNREAGACVFPINFQLPCLNPRRPTPEHNRLFIGLKRELTTERIYMLPFTSFPSYASQASFSMAQRFAENWKGNHRVLATEACWKPCWWKSTVWQQTLFSHCLVGSIDTSMWSAISSDCGYVNP